jgi:hypothetical protein
MQLHSVTVAATHPLQCAVVTDNETYADQVVAFLKRRFPDLGGVIYREHVDCYYPPHMTEPDKAIADAMSEFKYYTPKPEGATP